MSKTLVQDLKRLKERIEGHTLAIGAHRDELRKIKEELEELVQSLDDANESFASSMRLLEYAIDQTSQLL